MIAVDTNVLLRHLLDDDVHQSPRAHRLFDGEDDVLITDIVLAETIWTMTGRRYGLNSDDVVAVVTGLLEDSAIEFEDREAVWVAVNEFADSRAERVSYERSPEVDFADALIVNKARFTIDSWDGDYRGTYTFDRAALSLTGTREA